jgi:hypothetical protein
MSQTLWHAVLGSLTGVISRAKGYHIRAPACLILGTCSTFTNAQYVDACQIECSTPSYKCTYIWAHKCLRNAVHL